MRLSYALWASVCTYFAKSLFFFLFFQAEDGRRDLTVTGVQTCALPIYVVALWVLLDALDDCGFRGHAAGRLQRAGEEGHDDVSGRPRLADVDVRSGHLVDALDAGELPADLRAGDRDLRRPLPRRGALGN